MQDMPMEPEAAAPEAGGGDPIALVKQGGDVLSQLAGMVDALPNATDQDRAEAAQLLDSYMALAERLMAGGSRPADEGMVPADAGMKGVPVGPQGRM